MCKVAGCSSQPKSRGLCSRHYERFRLGKPLVQEQETRLRGSGGINSNGYVYYKDVKEYEHRMVAAVALGRTLKSTEFVHHIDENPANNVPNNLVICSPAYHKLLHRRTRAFEACGHYDWLTCYICKEYSSPNAAGFSVSNTKEGLAWHKSCAAKRQYEIRNKV